MKDRKKMKKCRQAAALFLAVCILAAALLQPDLIQRVQAEVLQDGDYTYQDLPDGTVQITKYAGSASVLEVPASLNGKTVSAINMSAFTNNEHMTQITIPAGVTKLTELAGGDMRRWGIYLTDFYVDSGNSTYAAQDGILFTKDMTRLLRCPEAKDGQYTIPSSVTHIETLAFAYNAGLTQITIPASVKNIDAQAFWRSTALQAIQADSANTVVSSDQGVLYNKSKTLLIHFPGGKAGEYDILPGTTAIDSSAFQQCVSLTKVTIPSSVTDLYEGSFLECGRLTAIEADPANPSFSSDQGVLFNKDQTRLIQYPGGKTGAYTIPAGVAGIGEAFCGSTHLTEVIFPAGVHIANIEDAFYGCSELAAIRIDSGNPYYSSSDGMLCSKDGKKLLRCPEGKEGACTLPAQVETIREYAFHECWKLTEITIPDGMDSVGALAFPRCVNLVQVTIPESVTTIGTAAFYGCDNLKDVYYAGTQESWNKISISAEDYYEDGVSSNAPLTNAAKHFREDGAEYDWAPLSDGTVEITSYNGSDAVITIPSAIGGKTVSRIGEEAFMGCGDLTGVMIPDSVVRIGAHAFNDCASLSEIEIPSSVTEIGTGVFAGCAALAQIRAADGNTAYRTENGLLYSKDLTTLLACPNAKTGTVQIPEGVAQICPEAFRGCGALTGAALPDSVAVIGESAFEDCTSLTGIRIPDKVAVIEQSTFSECRKLSQVQLSESITDIEVMAFSGCESLTELVIPDKVTRIGEVAFQACAGLTSITIPAGMREIEDSAFIRCRNLQDVYYGGTKAQWDRIQIEPNGNQKLLNAALHVTEDPEPEIPQEPVLPSTVNAKEELERLKAGDALCLEQDFSHYLSPEQIDILESYLYTWLAEVNYAYQYSGASGVQERVRKKAGIDPQGDFLSGAEQAITHVSVKTAFGTKTFTITLDLGKPDSGGSLYPSYGAMHYEVLPKGGIPSDVPVSGQFGKASYADLGPFAESVRKTCENTLHNTYQWQSLSEEMVAGILIDKTITEIIGNKNGAFSDGIFTIYGKPLVTYSKIVTIACPVDVYIYGMDGKDAGTIIDNSPDSKDKNVRLDVTGDTKTVYLTGNDYYLNLRGTDTGTMKYEVEEIANEEVCRSVQFLELQLKKDMQYEGYVFRPLNIDSDLYALRTVGGSASGEVTYADRDSFEPAFKKVQGMSLSQQNTSMNTDQNKTVQLNASLFPLDASNPNLVWISDNPGVASVGSDGLVTAVGAGRATITVMTRDGSFLKQSCIVDVERNRQPEPENPADPDSPSKEPDTPGTPGTSDGTAQPDSPDGSQPGTSDGSGTRPGTSDGTGTRPGTGTSGGTGTPSTQPGTQDNPGKEPPKDDGPVVAKLFYIVQFHANGGTNLSRRTMTLLNGDTLGILPKVQRKAYLFGGWYTQQTGGAKVNGEKKLNEATTLYARWTKAKAPAKARLQAVKSAKKGQVKASFQKVSGAAGYQVQYAANNKFTAAKTVTAGAAAKAKTLTGLKAGKKYYVRVRAYTADSMGNRIYGAYSAAKSVKVKKVP